MTSPVAPSPKDFLMGGAKTPSISWKGKPIGTSFEGVVARECKTIQQTDPENDTPLFWDEARTRPKWQLVVYLDLGIVHPDVQAYPDHDGVWAWYVKGASAEKELREAVAKAGDAKTGVREGARIRVTLAGHGEQKNKAFNPPNLFAVEYTRPADPSAAFLAQGDEAQAPTADTMRTQAQAIPAPPAGIDPAAWAAMTPERRQAVLAAMGVPAQDGFQDVPPF